LFLERAVPKEAREAYRRESIGALFGGVYTGAIFPFIGFIARDSLHASATLIGLMVAAPFMGNVFALFYANAVEGKPKMPYVVWSQVLARALFLLILFAKTPLVFAVIVTAVQVIASAAGPAYAAILKEIYPDDYRGRIMAYIRVSLAFVTLVSTLLVGRLLKYVDFNYIFPVAGIFGVVAALVFGTIRTAPVDPQDSNHKDSTLKFLLNTLAIFKEDRNYTWFALSVFAYGFGNLVAVPLYPIFQVDRLHISAIQVAMLSNVATAVWMLSYLYWGKYIDTQNPLKAVMVNALLASLVPLNYFLARNVWMLLPSAVIGGVTLGGVELSYFNSILYLAKAGRESHYQALHSFFLGIRGTIAPLCGAAIILLFKSEGIDVRYVFLIAMTLMLFGAVLQLIGVRQRY